MQCHNKDVTKKIKILLRDKQGSKNLDIFGHISVGHRTRGIHNVYESVSDSNGTLENRWTRAACTAQCLSKPCFHDIHSEVSINVRLCTLCERVSADLVEKPRLRHRCQPVGMEETVLFLRRLNIFLNPTDRSQFIW